MSGRGKSGKVKGRPSPGRAGLDFSFMWVGFIGCSGEFGWKESMYSYLLLRKGNYVKRVGAGASSTRHGCSDGISGCRDLGVGWQRCQRQQEVSHHPKAPTVCHQVRSMQPYLS